MSGRTADEVTAALVKLACAGITDPGLRDRTADRVAELVDECCRLVREDEKRRARQSLGQAWGAWLDMMTSVKLPGSRVSLLQEVLYFEPGLRERFLDALNGENRG